MKARASTSRTIAPGVEVPSAFEWEALGDDSTPDLRMTFAVVDDRVVCTGVTLAGSEAKPVTASVLRLLRFEDLMATAIAQNARVTLTASEFAASMSGRGMPERIVSGIGVATRRRAATDLAEVARIYEAARSSKDAIAALKKLGNSEGTAWRLIRRAREAGLIAPRQARG